MPIDVFCIQLPFIVGCILQGTYLSTTGVNFDFVISLTALIVGNNNNLIQLGIFIIHYSLGRIVLAIYKRLCIRFRGNKYQRKIRTILKSKTTHIIKGFIANEWFFARSIFVAHSGFYFPWKHVISQCLDSHLKSKQTLAGLCCIGIHLHLDTYTIPISTDILQDSWQKISTMVGLI